MTTALAPESDLNRTLRQLATEIRNTYRHVLLELRLDLVEGGVVLRGRAIRFYGKQVAFHEVKRRCRLPVLANQITVQERPGKSLSAPT